MDAIVEVNDQLLYRSRQLLSVLRKFNYIMDITARSTLMLKFLSLFVGHIVSLG